MSQVRRKEIEVADQEFLLGIGGRSVDDLTARVGRKELNDGEALLARLRTDLTAMLTPSSQPLSIPQSDSPFVILMIGVNGVGKTTTIGKLARRLQEEGRSVMLAAGDTFRAAAVEQLQVWGERNNIPVVAQHTGADSASVIYDALESAKAKNIDVLIACIRRTTSWKSWSRSSAYLASSMPMRHMKS